MGNAIATIKDEVEAVLAEAQLPFVQDIKVRVGTDWSGEDAVYVYLIIPDEKVRSAEFQKHALELDWRVFKLIQSITEDFWPYISFRAASDPPPF